MGFSPPTMAIHNSMVELCCYAAFIAIGIASKSSDPHRVFQHPRLHPPIDNPAAASDLTTLARIPASPLQDDMATKLRLTASVLQSCRTVGRPSRPAKR